MEMHVPDIEGIPDIRLRPRALSDGGLATKHSEHGTGDGDDVLDNTMENDANDPDAMWKLNSSFLIDSLLLEDLCEEIEDETELKKLLENLLTKAREHQRLIIQQFSKAIGEEVVNTKTLEQFLPRQDFIAHAGGIDALIDEETSDDVYSQLCGYPFEKVQKQMNLHIYVHAWVRLANLYSMFASADGNAEFVDILAQMDFFADKLTSNE